MVDPLVLRNLAWAVTSLLEVVLLILLVRRKLYRIHPAFFAYVLAALLQSILVASAYRYFGSQSWTSWTIAWGSQAAVVGARWFAVAGIARYMVAGYHGIWKMTTGILFVLGIAILVYSIATCGGQWWVILLITDRAVELCIAAFIVCVLLFIRYYQVPVATRERLLATGFCLYSCFFVINDSIYENWRRLHSNMWNALDIVTFFATLLLWINAVRSPAEGREPAPQPSVSPELYGTLASQLDSRLKLLNRRLDHLFRSGDSPS